jgi:hypothetical protein
MPLYMSLYKEARDVLHWVPSAGSLLGSTSSTLPAPDGAAAASLHLADAAMLHSLFTH